MRWIVYTFIGLTSLLIAAVAMIVTLVVLLDQNQLRDGLVHVVNRTTDNQLEINGPLALNLSLSPSIKVSNIHFKNATDVFEFSAADLSLQIDLLSLRTKYMIVNEIIIKNGVVNIRQTANQDKQDDDQAINIKIPVIERLQIVNLVIHYRELDETTPLEIRLESLQKDAPAGAETIALTGAGTIDGKAFKLEGESGLAVNLLETDKPFPFDYHIDVMQAVIHAEGRIINPRGTADLDIALQVEAPDVQGLLDLLHASTPDIGALAATGRLAGSLSAPRLDDLELKISKDKVALQVSGSVDNLLTAEGIQLDFSSDITDEEILASLLPEQSPHFNTLKTAGKFSGSADDLLLSDYTLDASGHKGLRLGLAGSARFIKSALPFRDVKATLSIASPDSAFARQFNEAIPLLGPVAGTARVSMASDLLLIDGIKLTAGNKQKLQIAATGDVKLAFSPTQTALAGLELDVDLQAPSTASLTPLVGTGIPALGVIKGVAHVSAASGVAAITSLDINVNKGKDFQLALNGTLADLEKLTGIDMKIELSASNLNTLGMLFDQSLPEEGPVKVSGRASGSLEKIHYTARTHLRNTTVSTDLTATLTGKRTRLAGTVTIPDLDVRDIGIYPERRVAPASAPDREEFDQVASKQASAAEDLISKEPIDFSGLNAIDLDLEFTIKKLSSTPKSISDIYTHILLDNGKFQFKPLKYSVDNDVINNDFMLNSATKPPTVSLLLNGDDIDLGLLLARSATDKPLIRGTMTTKVDLKSRGQSPAALAANLDGKIEVVTENARIDKSAMNLLNVDVIGWAISNILSPNKDVNIECAIFIMHFDKGLGATDLHIIDTPDTLIKIDARIDLVKQTMDVAIVPEHKHRLFQTKKDPMEIYGPIANPRYKLVSVKDLAQETGRAAILAPLTLSTSLLGSLTHLIVKPDDPGPGSCDKFLK